VRSWRGVAVITYFAICEPEANRAPGLDFMYATNCSGCRRASPTPVAAKHATAAQVAINPRGIGPSLSRSYTRPMRADGWNSALAEFQQLRARIVFAQLLNQRQHIGNEQFVLDRHFKPA
jgi:hypothetical protein